MTSGDQERHARIRAARRARADRRRRGRRGGSRRTAACSSDSARALAAATPTRSAPARPGPAVTAIASTSCSATPAVAHARWSVGTIASRWARDATSGTTPPNRACSSTERRHRVRQQHVAAHDADTGLVAGRLDAKDEGFAHRTIVPTECPSTRPGRDVACQGPDAPAPLGRWSPMRIPAPSRVRGVAAAIPGHRHPGPRACRPRVRRPGHRTTSRSSSRRPTSRWRRTVRAASARMARGSPTSTRRRRPSARTTAPAATGIANKPTRPTSARWSAIEPHAQRRYLDRAKKTARKHHRKPAIVFDADDTMLWTYDMEDAAMHFDFDPALQDAWVSGQPSRRPRRWSPS